MFKEIANAERAVGLQLDIPGVHVFPVFSNSHLTQQYRGVNPSAFVPKDETRDEGHSSQNIPSLSGLQRSPVAKKRKLHTGNIAYSYHNPQVSATAPLLLPSITVTNFREKVTSTPSQILATPEQPISVPKPTSTPLVVTSLESTPSSMNFPLTFSTRIAMTLCGEAISYDLEMLESDPRVIIELLKVTKSERGSWMIVGAHYRRTGNLKAAIIVMKDFLQGEIYGVQRLIACGSYLTVEMKTRKFSADKLKPAFLLLSGCETDLAKQAKADNRDASSHYNNAKYWLQKVYGATSPVPPLKPSNAANSSDCNFKLPRDRSANLDSLKHQLNTSPVHSTPKLVSHNRILEREVDALRDKQKDQAYLLADMRFSNRKLEDDLTYEHNMRRKLQRQLAEAEKERDSAIRLEAFALEQVKREVKARREAEEKANTEREMRLQVEGLSQAKASQNLIENLAKILREASSMEVDNNGAPSSK